MAIKFLCDIDDLGENWIEMSDRWTHAESKAAEKAMGGGWKDYLEYLATKVEGCRLQAGDVILTDFKDVTEQALDMMDLRLVGFVGGILQQTTMRLRALGNASARVSSPKQDGKK